ncbi:MAG: 4Fe-4S binding protein [Dehalococcoidia bacterium]|nr:4Fe-4S binding protein [Dehalococcoidia bacterium]
MEQSTYEKLADAIQSRGGGVPTVRCQDYYNILNELFTEEEARLAAILPETPVSADMLIDKADYKLNQLEVLLEGMAKKGLVFSIKIADKRYYVLFPLVPGMMENQLLTGIVNEKTKKIARLFEKYFLTITQKGKSNQDFFSKVPYARIIVVDQNIPNDRTIQPYDKLLAYIDKAKDIAVVHCHCRQMGELLGNPCSKPKDVCLALGPGAHYMAEYGLGKLITKEEARAVIKRAEDEGLVHSVSNTGKYIDFICNCCICHCATLQAMKKSAHNGPAAVSSFISDVDADECIGCGDCTARCPMEALTMEKEIAIIDKKRCIGCGLCVSYCPTGAIKMYNREEVITPYTDAKQLNEAIVASISGGQKKGVD